MTDPGSACWQNSVESIQPVDRRFRTRPNCQPEFLQDLKRGVGRSGFEIR